MSFIVSVESEAAAGYSAISYLFQNKGFVSAEVEIVNELAGMVLVLQG